MTASAYPRERVEGVLTDTRLPLSCRIVPRQRIKSPLGTAPGNSRFCSKADSYTVLYAAPEFSTAFVETVVRDRFARKGPREILLKEITERAWAHIRSKPRTKLRLLDLRQDGCVKLGAPTDAVKARNHAAGQALGRAIHAEHKEVDGFLFSSRLTGADAYALFDRGLPKLDAAETGLLANHPELPAVLSRYDIVLVRT